MGCATGLHRICLAPDSRLCDHERVSDATAGPVATDLDTDTDDLDFAVAAYTEDEIWTVTPLVLRGEPDLAAVVSGLRRYPGEAGVLGMISVDEDFFILIRIV